MIRDFIFWNTEEESDFFQLYNKTHYVYVIRWWKASFSFQTHCSLKPLWPEFCFSRQGQVQDAHSQCGFMIICNMCWTVPQKAQPMSDGETTALVGYAHHLYCTCFVIFPQCWNHTWLCQFLLFPFSKNNVCLNSCFHGRCWAFSHCPAQYLELLQN